MQPSSRAPSLAAALLLLAARAPAQWAAQQDGRIYPQPNVLAHADQFAAALDLDGATLVVGAPRHDTSGAGGADGAAFVFTRGAGGWSQEAILLSSGLDGGDRLGAAVALQGDTVAVGAPFDEAGGPAAAGSVYVFVRQGGLWSEQAQLLASDLAQGDHFGAALALDGDTLAVGAPDEDDGGAGAGAVYVFTRSGGVWSEAAKLTASDAAAGDMLGASVALHGDVLVAGAPADDTPAGANAGSAYVFARSGGVWSEVAQLAAGDAAAGALFGAAVALDGDTAAVGAPDHDADKGAVYVFRESAGAWSEEAQLVDFGFQFVDRFGTDVDLEGDRLVVGLPYNHVGGLATGAVQLFVRSGSAWAGAVEMVGSDGDGNDFGGSAVALSGDLVASGAPSGETPPTGLPTGEAYVFELVPPPVIEVYCTPKVHSGGCAPAIGWSGFPSASNPNAFDVTCADALNFQPGLLFYGLAPAAIPFQDGTLCVAPPVVRTAVQHSLGNQPPPFDCSGSYARDMNAVIQSGGDPALVAGADVYAQYWTRDPGAASSTGLSDGLHFQILP